MRHVKRRFRCQANIASRFSAGVLGAVPPPHDTMMRRESSIGRSISATARRTSLGVPWASTSRGGMLPSKTTDGPAAVRPSRAARGCRRSARRAGDRAIRRESPAARRATGDRSWEGSFVVVGRNVHYNRSRLGPATVVLRKRAVLCDSSVRGSSTVGDGPL
jgi:hypothetical protein